MDPIASRPHLSSDYGVPSDTDDLLPWSYVTDRMASAMHYWISTVGSGGAPHTRPIAGIWLDDKIYFGGSPHSRWRRNLASNPHACINLSEEGDQAIILHGTVHSLRPDRPLAIRLADASNTKYAYGQKPDDYEGEGIFVFRPSAAFAWKLLTKDRTRWHLR